MDKPSCATCKFFVELEGGQMAECHRFPPHATSLFARIGKRDWCGEHQPEEVPEQGDAPLDPYYRRAARPFVEDFRRRALQMINEHYEQGTIGNNAQISLKTTIGNLPIF